MLQKKSGKFINKQKTILNFKGKVNKKNERIEILDFEENTKYEEKKPKLKVKFHIKNKFKFSLVCLVMVAVLFMGVSFITGKNVAMVGVKKVLNGLGIYTEEIKNIELQSDNYNEPGSWHIDKSAKWTSSNTAKVTFDVQSVMEADGRYKDIILVLDVSWSMNGEKLNKAISDSKELVSYLLNDSHNRVAIVTFESSSNIVSKFSNKKEELLTKLDAITTIGCTNYNAALQNVDTVMNGYMKESNRDVVTLFLTDGYPNEDTPIQVGTYEVLKDKYPYMTINGVQYEMGTDVIEEIKQITDDQWVANQSTLNNVLFDATISPIAYEEFIVTDYIHNDYFRVNSVDDIKVTKGTVKLEEESGLQKITWNLGSNSYMTGGTIMMEINVTLKEQEADSGELYPTNKKESVTSKLPEENEKTVNSSNTPVLKNRYEVIYDTNAPEGCTLDSYEKEKYFVYQNVTRKTTELSCNGYLFKGWEIDGEDVQDIKKVNDDVFMMPEHGVTIRGTWTKQAITKTMDGTVYKSASLYKVLENAAKDGTYAKEYTGVHQDSMDVSKSTEKIYHWHVPYTTTGDALAIEILNKNNVIFAGQCWQMMRTTDTGGVKMIYNGEAEDGKCLNTRGTHVGYKERTRANFRNNYWYGTDYTYDATTKRFKISGTTEQTAWNEITGPSLIGKYTCLLTVGDETCSTLYLVESYEDSSNGFVILLNSDSHYSQFGTLQFNANNGSPAYVGYMHNIAYQTQNISDYKTGKLVIQKGPVEFDEYGTVTNDPDYPYTFDDTTKQWSSSNHADSSKSTFEFSPTVAGEYYLSYTIGSESKYDKATFYVDGTSKGTVSGSSTSSISLGTLTTSNVIKVEYSKDSVASTQPDKVSFNLAKKIGEIDNRWKYGRDVEYKDGKYRLIDAVPVDLDTEFEQLNHHQYTCLNNSESCEKISYIYAHYRGSIYYIQLENSTNIEKAINQMFYVDDVNKINSTIKSGVDAWYKKYLLDYDEYLEDTIFCNDRSISDIGGWNQNVGNVNDENDEFLKFKESYSSNDLSCANVTDRFSVSNEQAKLTYKVGLMSNPEITILNNGNIPSTRKEYWLASPMYFHPYYYARSRYMAAGTGTTGEALYTKLGVRPAVSLKPGTKYSDGDGSMEHPYIVDLG